jgi:hypothetical protein
MATVARTRVRFAPDFYVIMSLLLVGIVVFGFSHTVPGDFATPGFPPFIAMHGALFAAWMLLFVAQPALVASNNTAVHRKLGWLGFAIAIGMLGLGGYAVLFALRSGQVPPFYPHGLFLTRGTFGLAMFFGLVIAAIANRRKPQWHKRLLLCATTVVVIPALERSLPIPLFGAGWYLVVDGVADTILLIGPIADLIARRRVHPAYGVAIAAIVLGQATSDLVAPSPIATAMLHTLGAR